MKSNPYRIFNRRKTKIVCTIGPASSSPSVIKRLVESGMDVARLNFSHGSFDFFEKVIGSIRKISPAISILADLPGPKIRVVNLGEKGIVLKENDDIYLMSDIDRASLKENPGSRTIFINYDNIKKDINKNDNIFIDDGKIKLRIIKDYDSGKGFLCKIINGGHLRPEKGVNFPGITLNIDSVTKKDLNSIDFCIKMDIDIYAVSFVRKSEDVTVVKEYVKRKYKKDIFIVSKIEKAEAVKNLNSIIGVSDGIMVARGDLGIETDMDEIGLLQKRIIKAANFSKKPVITATQMLESMVSSESPTRAEVTDITNAILDGTDAVMLSEETAVGVNPVAAVGYMDKISAATEGSPEFKEKAEGFSSNQNTESNRSGGGISYIVARMAVSASFSVENSFIAAVTRTGFTASLISSLKPLSPVIAIVFNYKVLRRLNLSFGIRSIMYENLFPGKRKQVGGDIGNIAGDDIKKPFNLEPLIEGLKGVSGPGCESGRDLNFLILCGGIPAGKPGTTDFVKVIKIR